MATLGFSGASSKSAALLVVVLCGLSVPALAVAQPEPPVLASPAHGAETDVGEPFLVEGVEDGGESQIQMAIDDFETLVCDTGWIANGFFSTVWWDAPGPIGFSEVDCPLTDGDYIWRARTRTAGLVESDWSAVQTFSVGFMPSEPEDEPEGDPDPDPWEFDPPLVTFEPDPEEPAVEMCATSPDPETDPVLDAILAEPDDGDSLADESVLDDDVIVYESDFTEEAELTEEQRVGAFDQAVGLDEEQTLYSCGGDREGPFDTKYRRTKLFDLHLAPGMRGEVEMGRSRETRVEAALKIGLGPWQVSGYHKEELGRGQRAGFPKTGPFHRRLAPRYKYQLFRRCFTTHPEGERECRYAYLLMQWTGEIARLNKKLAQAPFDRDNAIRLWSVGAWWAADEHSNRTYGASVGGAVQIAELALSGHVGYSSNTSITFKALAGCARWFIYGASDLPANAKVIYTRTTGCS